MENNRLHEILQAETTVVEQILDVVKLQQHSIIYFRNGELMGIVEREQQLLQSLASLEKERQTLFAQQCEMNDDAVAKSKQQLKALTQKVVAANNQNKLLIGNALLFVRQIIRVITNNFTKRLVDTKA